MANLKIAGLNGIIEDYETLANLPAEIQENMLNAEANVVIAAQKAELEKQGLIKSKQLRDSIARNRKVQKSGLGMYMDILPQGTRKDGMRNEELGFLLEFGAPKRHIEAKNWMKRANEGCEVQAVEAAEKVFHEYLGKNNL